MTARIRALLLIALGFLIRFWASGNARFTGDESHYWFVSRQLARFETFPVYGPEITGSAAHLPGALYYYLMAVPQLLGASPRFGAVMVIVGHLLAAWLLYLLLEETRGPTTALVGLAFAVITPWDVLYSDRIWGSCVVPILGSIAIYAAVRARDSGRWQTVLIAINLVLPQLHLSSPVLWIACGTIVLLRPPGRWNRRAVLAALAIVVIAYAPMGIAELASGFSNTRMIFAKAGGQEPWSKVVLIPLEMIGYAIFYGSAELSYHFGRGYWGGYDDLARYATVAGWTRWLDHEGPAIATLTILSIALSLALWIAALIGLSRHVGAAVRTRRREALRLEDVVFLGLLAGLAGGIALLVPAKKGYFPHYANVLMPMLLWPLALGFDIARRSRLRPLVISLAAVSAAAMLTNVFRYYRDVDGLNGLAITVDMVGEALAEGRPVDVQFEHFNNGYAWSLIARGVYGRDLPMQRGALVRWRVENGSRHEGPVPEGARLFGPVLVKRGEHTRPRPPDLVYRASEQWRSIEVEGKSTCKAAAGPECRYGDQPWQHLIPDALEMNGRPEPVLFFHPIAGARVVAHMTIPAARRGLLHYGLSDAAHQSTNQAPVLLVLRQGDRVVLDAKTEALRGLKNRPFTLTSTGSPTLDLEISTTDDGARVMGFDLDLFR